MGRNFNTTYTIYHQNLQAMHLREPIGWRDRSDEWMARVYNPKPTTLPIHSKHDDDEPDYYLK